MKYVVSVDEDKVYILRMRELREAHGYTQQHIAKLLNTSQTMYTRYERGINALPIRHLFYLSKLYHVSSDYILGLTDEPNPGFAGRTKPDKPQEYDTPKMVKTDRFGIRWKTSK